MPYLLPLLSCETGDLTRLRSCRMPLAVSFQKDIRRIAASVCRRARMRLARILCSPPS